MARLPAEAPFSSSRPFSTGTSDLAADCAAASCAALAELREAAEEKKLRSEVAGSSALLHVLFVVDGSLNRPRQQSVALCGFNRQSLGCLDLSVEELVECCNQIFRWPLLDDGTYFVSKTYRRESGKRPHARKYDIDYEPFHC